MKFEGDVCSRPSRTNNIDIDKAALQRAVLLCFELDCLIYYRHHTDDHSYTVCSLEYFPQVNMLGDAILLAIDTPSITPS